MTTTHPTLPFTSLDELLGALTASSASTRAEAAQAGVEILDAAGFRDGLIDRLIATAVFGEGPERDAARWLIRAAAPALGAFPASIHDLYMAAGRGEYANPTAPAINVRGLAYDMMRAVFRAARANDCKIVLFELARSEMGYTEQRPGEYASNALAAAIKEGHQGPVFIQGDHYQINAKKYASDPDARAGGAARADRRGDRRRLLQHRHRRLDHRRSLPADAGRAAAAQRPPDRRADRVHPRAGAGRGHRLDRRRDRRGRAAQLDGRGAARLHDRYLTSCRTGSDARARPGGNQQDQRPDRDQPRRRRPAGRHDRRGRGRFRDAGASCREVARIEYGLGGAVQHGASTLPEEAFGRFAEANAIEVHLATAFQNQIFDTPPSRPI